MAIKTKTTTREDHRGVLSLSLSLSLSFCFSARFRGVQATGAVIILILVLIPIPVPTLPSPFIHNIITLCSISNDKLQAKIVRR